MKNKKVTPSSNNIQQSKKHLDHIAQDAHDLFSGLKTGHVGYMRYGSPEFEGDQVLGAQFWYNSQNLDDYYLSREDQNLLHQILASGDLESLNVTTVVDFGPGDIYAVANKAIPLTNTLKAQQYIAVDMCENYARDAALCVATSSKIDTSYRMRNFFTKEVDLLVDDALFFMAGSTISNIPIDIRVKDFNLHLTAFMSRMRRVVKNRGYFLIGYDANNDEDSLCRSYCNGPPVSRFYENALWMIERDSDYAFDPSAFAYQGRWIAEEYRFAHYLVAQRDVVVTSPHSETYYFHEGAALHIDNSYKFPVAVMERAAANAGWKTKKIWTETGRVHYILLEAV
jgi:L-histidine N-alpha-methyltransferase